MRGVQAPRQVVHELGLGHAQGLGDVVVPGAGASQREVLPDAHREQRRVLEGGGHDTAQLLQRQVAHVDAVQGDPALGHVVQPPGQRGERGLARAGRPDQRDGLTRLDHEVDTGEHRTGRTGMAEADALESQPGR